VAQGGRAVTLAAAACARSWLVRIIISAGRADRRRRDIDNLSKPILDRLVAHQVIEDDSSLARLELVHRRRLVLPIY